VEQNFYRHSDGYPTGVMPTLGRFMKLVKEGRIRDDVMQAGGWLVAFGIKEHREYGYTGDLEPGPAGTIAGWKVGAYEPDPYPLHGDEQFVYTLNLADKSIMMDKLDGKPPVYMKGWEPVNGKCPTCGHKIKPASKVINTSVVSSNGDDIYLVGRDENGEWSCTCPDHVYRQHDCKHIHLVRSGRL
jgi:hypothetical protein